MEKTSEKFSSSRITSSLAISEFYCNISNDSIFINLPSFHLFSPFLSLITSGKYQSIATSKCWRIIGYLINELKWFIRNVVYETQSARLHARLQSSVIHKQLNGSNCINFVYIPQAWWSNWMEWNILFAFVQIIIFKNKRILFYLILRNLKNCILDICHDYYQIDEETESFERFVIFF